MDGATCIVAGVQQFRILICACKQVLYRFLELVCGKIGVRPIAHPCNYGIGHLMRDEIIEFILDESQGIIFLLLNSLLFYLFLRVRWMRQRQSAKQEEAVEVPFHVDVLNHLVGFERLQQCGCIRVFRLFKKFSGALCVAQFYLSERRIPQRFVVKCAARIFCYR